MNVTELQQTLTRFNELVHSRLKAVVRKTDMSKGLSDETLRELCEDTIGVFEDTAGYETLVKMGVAERDVKASLFDLLMEAVDHGEVEICPIRK